MAKILRFLIYGGMSFFVLVSKGQEFKTCIDVFVSDNFYFEDGAFLGIHAALLLGLTSYFIWLIGATFSNWRMPLWSHLLPFAAIVFLLWENGWIYRTENTMPGMKRAPTVISSPVDRAMNAMLSAKLYLESHGCTLNAAPNILNNLGTGRISGYRRHGMAMDWKIDISQGEGAVVELPARAVSKPGTLLIQCNEKDRTFAISALISDAIPQGAPVFVVDGVGKPVTFVGKWKEK